MQRQMIVAMKNRTPCKDERELKSEIMDQLEEAVDEYFASFKAKSNDRNSLPTIDDIEDLLGNLRSKTRDIYLKAVSDTVNNFDESELIDSKKENTGKEG